MKTRHGVRKGLHVVIATHEGHRVIGAGKTPGIAGGRAWRKLYSATGGAK